MSKIENSLPWKKYIQNTSLDKSSKTPLYAQLADVLRYMMDNSILREQDKLPTEKELCKFYDVSRTAVRQALLELTTQGKIYRERGKGSFVKSSRITQDLVKFYSFTEEVKRLGKVPFSRILQFEKIPIPKIVREKLVGTDTHVYRIVRLRMADEQPIYYETTYLPSSRLKGFRPQLMENNSMYAMLLNEYNIKLIRAEEYFSVAQLSAGAAKFLGEKKGTSVIKQERVSYDVCGAVEYTSSLLPENRFVYRVIVNYS